VDKISPAVSRARRVAKQDALIETAIQENIHHKRDRCACNERRAASLCRRRQTDCF
jgi:hypothetical protein